MTPVSPETICIPLDGPLQEATFVARPNRFIGVVRLLGQKEAVLAHIADPGRLKELLIPGVRVLVRDYGEPQPGATRKLRYGLPLVYAETGHWVSIHSQLPNKLIQWMLTHNHLPHYEGTEMIRREYTYAQPDGEKSRFDFLLKTPTASQCLLEVKGASLVEDGVCRFPDAPTVRGTRHIRGLIAAQKAGLESRVAIVVQRNDAQQFQPHHERDPAFAKALKEAVATGVQINAYCFEMTPTHARYCHEVPVRVNF